MNPPQFILEINTRVWLRELGRGTPLSLSKVPESFFEEWQKQGFDTVWLMGVWLPSPGSYDAALKDPFLLEDYHRALPDWRNEDVGGSPYAVRGYTVNSALGGEAALADFRARLAKRGMRLLLDFVPNHLAIDHPWLSAHPEWFVTGTEADVVRNPAHYFWITTAEGPRAIAHGRDPYFPPWTDSAQLNYHDPNLQAAMRGELARLATLCDGVRCDMAMLELSDVFEEIWKRRPLEFWPRAIAETKKVNPNFFMMAEVYWGLDGVLRNMGFDATYDKELMDIVAYGKPLRRAMFDIPASEHRRRVRFLENHDEPRVASRLDPPQNIAAATWVFALPTVRLLYDGQLDGRKVRLPTQLLREPDEPVNAELRARYATLLHTLEHPAVRNGHWHLLSPQSAWVGNITFEAILGQAYDLDDAHLRIFINWSENRSQCWVPLGLESLSGMEVELHDLVGPKSFVRDGMELMMRGLYLDLEPWETHVFECVLQPAPAANE
ncbi:MAG TPA: alpha-amylase family glycosyl hydrolase [bacterium]